MSIVKQGIVVAGMLALAACGTNNTKAENAAANVRATAENQADMVENRADAMRDSAENRADATENRADAIRDAAENKADAIERTDGATANTTGM